MAFKKTPAAKPPVTVDDFVAAAGQPVAVAATSEPVAATVYPWEGKRSDKPTEVYNMRFTEEQKAKLQFIADNSKYSIQSFVLEALLPAIEQEIKRLTD